MVSILDTSIAPFTGFGDDANSSIKFGIDVTGQDTVPNWTGGEPDLTTHRVRNSSDVITQLHGREPRTLTLRLWFASLDDLEALEGVQGAQATLRYLWGITSRAGGTKETRGAHSYLVLPETLLARVTDQRTYIGGTAEAVATFQRAVGAASYYGFAVYAED
jgi:hypothetical protein